MYSFTGYKCVDASIFYLIWYNSEAPLMCPNTEIQSCFWSWPHIQLALQPGRRSNSFHFPVFSAARCSLNLSFHHSSSKYLQNKIYLLRWDLLQMLQQKEEKKSCIRETLNILMCADSSTDTTTDKNWQKGEKQNEKNHVSRVTCQVSGVRCQVSHVRCQVSGQVKKGNWTNWDKLGLLRLVSTEIGSFLEESHCQVVKLVFSSPGQSQVMFDKHRCHKVIH